MATPKDRFIQKTAAALVRLKETHQRQRDALERKQRAALKFFEATVPLEWRAEVERAAEAELFGESKQRSAPSDPQPVETGE